MQQPSGWVTIAAHAQDPAWYEMARLISWSGYVPTTTDANPLGLPTFAGDSGILGDAYTTTEFSPPSINVSYSQPCVHISPLGAFNHLFRIVVTASVVAWVVPEAFVLLEYSKHTPRPTTLHGTPREPRSTQIPGHVICALVRSSSPSQWSPRGRMALSPRFPLGLTGRW